MSAANQVRNATTANKASEFLQAALAPVAKLLSGSTGAKLTLVHPASAAADVKPMGVFATVWERLTESSNDRIAREEYEYLSGATDLHELEYRSRNFDRQRVRNANGM